MKTAMKRLDEHYAMQLGCTPEDLSSERMIVVTGQMTNIRFAKSYPLAIFAMSKGRGGVISVRIELKAAAERAVEGVSGAGLDDALCDAVEREVGPGIPGGGWFRGIRLFCEPESFVDQSIGEVREVTAEDDISRALHARWGGPVFGQVADGRIVSWAAVKPLSEVVWDLSIQTLDEYRGQGYAKSAVSAALKHVVAHGKLAAWGTDRTNAASLAAARSVGFRDYALELGCIER